MISCVLLSRFLEKFRPEFCHIKMFMTSLPAAQSFQTSHRSGKLVAKYITCPQTKLLVHKLYYLSTNYITYAQTILLVNKLHYLSTNYSTCPQAILLVNELYY